MNIKVNIGKESERKVRSNETSGKLSCVANENEVIKSEMRNKKRGKKESKMEKKVRKLQARK